MKLFIMMQKVIKNKYLIMLILAISMTLHILSFCTLNCYAQYYKFNINQTSPPPFYLDCFFNQTCSVTAHLIEH